ncbi:uncharacterized protein LOC122061169 [Macadamia integrifolia]|uniref:uncharacterized protein LOC122061169 n=1 Tax=Macadamia integrifolia TaxID=60698 RepID=UPI001C530854|nr:uncharacterized protein LOC122061169 [Macadamia integrifolia]
MLIKINYDHHQMVQGYLIEVLPSTTFLQLKQNIETVLGAKVARQTLLMNSLELRDDHNVEFYDLVEESDITLRYKQLPPGQKLHLTVITPTKWRYRLQVEETITVSSLKEEIQKLSNIRAEDMALFYHNNEMEVDDFDLLAYFVSDGSTITIKLTP